MRVTLFGATGRVGQRILAELSARSHETTIALRDPTANGAPGHIGNVVRADVTDADSIATAAAGTAAVISAVGGAAAGDPAVVERAAHALLEGVERAGVERLLVVGGAGSLLTPTGERLIDTADFPEAWKPGSRAQSDALEVYGAYDGPVVWTYLSPQHLFRPGERTGTYVVGDDSVMLNQAGESTISMEDFAVAMVDELEQQRFPRRRFTVGSL
ncbi:MAG: NAD(P)-dependent oxidoreductase [Solirubrobacteraceae bacterium]